MKNATLFFCCFILTIFSACSDNKIPSDLLNGPAAIPASFGFDEKGFKVLNSLFNEKEGTVSMVYGNEKAKSAAIHISSDHLAGTGMALVTWKMAADKHWFGAHIPGELLSVETIRFDSLPQGQPLREIYTRYAGKDLVKQADTANGERMNYINELAIRPAVMP